MTKVDVSVNTGFPTVGEIVKTLIEAFDFYDLIDDGKKRNSFIKKVNRFADEKNFDMDKAGSLIKEVLFKSFGKLIDDKMLFEEIYLGILSLFESYKTLILTQNVNLIDRDIIIRRLITHYAVYKISDILHFVTYNKYDMKMPTKKFWWVPYKENDEIVFPLANVVNWWANLTNADSTYKLSKLIAETNYQINKKEYQKDFISERKDADYKQKERWKSNKNLPRASTIDSLTSDYLGLPGGDFDFEKKLKLCLYIGRASHFVFNKLYEIFGDDTFIILENLKKQIQSETSESEEELLKFLEQTYHYDKVQLYEMYRSEINNIENTLQNKLTSIRCEKMENDNVKAFEILDEISKSNVFKSNYLFLWQKARYYLLQPDEKMWKQAAEFYNQAFEDAKYKSGIALRALIKEAIFLCSKIRAKSIVQKLYKWACFYGLFSDEFEIVENYFMDLRSKQFLYYFDPKIFYKTDIDKYEKMLNEKLNLHFFLFSNIENMKIDKRYPNSLKKIIGSTPRTQLMLFCNHGKVNYVKELLDLGADPNIIAADGGTALIMSIQSQFPPIGDENIECAKELLKKDLSKSINSRTKLKKITALQCAIESGRVDLVKEVIKQGADVNQRCTFNSKEGITPLYLTIGNIGKCILYLKSKGSLFRDPKTVNEALKYDTMMSVMNGSLYDSDYQRFQSRMNDDVDYRKIADEVLDFLIRSEIEKSKSYFEMIDTLLSSGADTEAVNINGFTALIFCSEIGDINIFDKLMSHNANIEKLLINNDNVLSLAIRNRNYEMFRHILTKYRTKVSKLMNIKYENIATGFKSTLLHDFILQYLSDNFDESGKVILNHIIDNNFDLELKDSYGKTALDVARMIGNEDIIKMIEGA
jgi:ankyrin repeat protein